MIAGFIALGCVVGLSVVIFVPATSLADPSSAAVQERRQPAPTADARGEYNRGVRARVAKDWPAATEAFRRAVSDSPDFADAWNELGYALRNQGRYTEAVRAYDEALRLQPDFPEALEYLGEAYVKMGRPEDARRVLERLRALDAGRAQELAEVIEKGK
jgi:Flp pilus assembly protein TadD